MFDFSDQSVLVTGASRGIGRAIARQFAAAGARVAIHYHANRDAAAETQTLLAGGPHPIVQGDMRDPDSVKQMVETAVAHLGRLDVLVNNAGVYHDHPATDVSYEEWQRQWRHILDTNLVGAANAIFCAVPHMKKQGYGRVVNVSSRGAFRGEPTAPAYGASKAGMNAMGQSLAKFLAPHHIFVGTVAPGFVETDMATDFLVGERGREIRSQSPLNRVATPNEVAYAVLFLASKGSEFMTGAIIDVNGASYLRT